MPPSPRKLAAQALQRAADTELDSTLSSITPLRLAFTGHRPAKLGGYSPASQTRLLRFAELIIAALKPAEVISGFALGWDLAIAEAAIRANIPLIAALPFPNQPSQWPATSIAHWHLLKSQAREVQIISPSYSLASLQRRNEWMVDNGAKLVALWDGSSGGTKNCIEYAMRIHKPWVNVWPQWESFQCQ